MYSIKYKREGKMFFNKLSKVKGHSYDSATDKLDVFFIDGIRSIHNWSKCDMKLGSDFMLFQKSELEKESSQKITISKE